MTALVVSWRQTAPQTYRAIAAHGTAGDIAWDRTTQAWSWIAIGAGGSVAWGSAPTLDAGKTQILAQLRAWARKN
jgi:hypothetical protein